MSSPSRVTFDPALVHPAVAERVAGYQSELVSKVEALVQQHDVFVIGMSINPFPGRARKLLASRGIAYEYLGLGSYFSQWRLRLGLKMWSGWPTFPMIFVKGRLIGGYTDLKRLADSGELAQLLQ